MLKLHDSDQVLGIINMDDYRFRLEHGRLPTI